MNQRIRMFLALCVMFAGVSGCDKLPFGKPAQPARTQSSAAQSSVALKGTVAARVNNIPVMLEDLNQEIEAYNNLVPADRPDARITTREKKLEYLKNQMVRATLLYQEGLDRRLDASEDVQRVLDKTKRELVILELLRKEAESLEPSAKDIEEYYNQYQDRLKKPEERHIREIVTASEAEARDILIQLLQGGDFASVAREKSIAVSAKEGGDLGFIKPGTRPREFEAVAFSDTIESGKISSVFKGPEGYYILKFEEKKGGEQLTLNDVEADIKRALMIMKQQQRMEELVSTLSRGAKIEVYEGEIK